MRKGLPEITKTLADYAEARTNAVVMLEQLYEHKNRLGDYLKQFGPHLTPDASRIYKDINHSIRELDRGFWRRSFEVTEFRKYMDHQAKTEFDRDIENNPPAFTIENIKETFFSLYQDADMMFQRGIVGVFKSLCGGFKTNKKEPFRVGEKIIITYTTDTFYSKPRVHYGREQIISDIDRVFKVLAGEKHNPRELEQKLNSQWAENDGVYECEFFKIKAFKNGNTHWYFKRLDLLDQVNELIAEYYGSNILSN